MKPLFLASGSPRRHELLQLLDRPFEVVRPSVPEQIEAGEMPVDYVARLAIAKAQAGRAFITETSYLVVGSDTVVVCDDQVLEKPRNKADYINMMQRLSGREHQALTAVAVIGVVAGELITVEQQTVATSVTFKPLTESEIDAYWQSGEPQDKAGGYGIQGRASKFVTQLNGNYSAVVGLPLYETEQLIQTAESKL